MSGIQLVYLSSAFYQDFSAPQYSEIEQKQNRPYVQVCVTINGVVWAIPLRSNINHEHVLWTDQTNKCGLDFSKAVVIEKQEYLDGTNTPWIRENEFQELKGKEFVISTKMEKYIDKYKKAKRDLRIPRNARLCQYSTLQYFEPYL